MKVANDAPSMLHLFFTDDSLILCAAKTTDVMQVMRILDVCRKASGQLINREKSSIFFSKNVENRQTDEVFNSPEKMQQVH